MIEPWLRRMIFQMLSMWRNHFEIVGEATPQKICPGNTLEKPFVLCLNLPCRLQCEEESFSGTIARIHQQTPYLSAFKRSKARIPFGIRLNRSWQSYVQSDIDIGEAFGHLITRRHNLACSRDNVKQSPRGRWMPWHQLRGCSSIAIMPSTSPTTILARPKILKASIER